MSLTATKLSRINNCNVLPTSCPYPVKNYPVIDFQQYCDELVTDLVDDKDYITDKTTDIYIQGGGMKILYAYGFIGYIATMYKQNKINIGNVHGCSSGAAAGLLLILLKDCHDNPEKYTQGSEDLRLTISKMIEGTRSVQHTYFTASKQQYIVDILINSISDVIPDDMYILASGKLHITVSALKWYGFERISINKFNSNDELLATLRTSASIPLITTPYLYNYFYQNGKRFIGIDGWAIKKDSDTMNKQRSIVISTIKVNYPFSWIIAPRDPFIESTLLRGILDSHQLFSIGKACFSYIKKPSAKKKGYLVPGTRYYYYISLCLYIGFKIFKCPMLNNMLAV